MLGNLPNVIVSIYPSGVRIRKGNEIAITTSKPAGRGPNWQDAEPLVRLPKTRRLEGRTGRLA